MLSLKFLALISHFIYTDKMSDKFANEVLFDGLIVPPHVALSYSVDGQDTYSSYEVFVGQDSIGEFTLGVGMSKGWVWHSESFRYKVGGLAGAYYNNDVAWGSMNDRLTVNLTQKHAVVPLVGAEVIVEYEVGNYVFVMTNRVMPTITTHTVGVGYSF